MTKIRTIAEGEVNLSHAYFVILCGESCREIAVLSATYNVDDMRIQFIEQGIDKTIIDMVHRKLTYYLYELENNPNPVNYLIYHCTTLSNAYDSVKIFYSGAVTPDNLLNYITLRSKMCCFYKDSAGGSFPAIYMQTITQILYDKAVGKRDFALTGAEFDYHLKLLHRLLYTTLPRHGEFQLEPFSLLHLSKWFADLSTGDLFILLNYLYHFRLAKGKQVTGLMKFYYQNHQFHNE